MAIDHCLTREGKETILRAMVETQRPDLKNHVASVTYDARFSYDFEVSATSARKAMVTFSARFSDERFPLVLERLFLAIEDIRATSATKIRGSVSSATSSE